MKKQYEPKKSNIIKLQKLVKKLTNGQKNKPINGKGR